MMSDDLEKYFSVFDNTTAQIAELKDYDDYHNTYDINVIGTVNGDIQPYSGELAHKEYGLKIECQYKLFCPKNDEIQAGRYIIADKSYEIMYVAKWDLGMAVLLKGVTLDDRR